MAYNKTDIVSQIAKKSNLTKAQAEAALDAFRDVAIDSLKTGEGLRLTGFMAVERVHRAARTGRNPRTNEPIEIPAGYSVKLTAGSLLKKAASGKN